MNIINKITNNSLVYPEDLAYSLYIYLYNKGIIIGKQYDDLSNALFHLKAVCENPFNAEYFRIFYDVLSAISETIPIQE